MTQAKRLAHFNLPVGFAVGRKSTQDSRLIQKARLIFRGDIGSRLIKRRHFPSLCLSNPSMYWFADQAKSSRKPTFQVLGTRVLGVDGLRPS
jgi:hypothetical protein